MEVCVARLVVLQFTVGSSRDLVCKVQSQSGSLLSSMLGDRLFLKSQSPRHRAASTRGMKVWHQHVCTRRLTHPAHLLRCSTNPCTVEHSDWS